MAYPEMLYRPGKALRWNGRDLDCLTVHDEAEETAARKDGWISPHELLNPLDHDGDGKAGGSRRRRGAK